MKYIAGTGKQSLINCNWGCAYANRIVVLAQGLDMFRLGAIAHDGRMIPSGNLPFSEKNFGCTDVWELNTQGLGSLWLKASATWGGSF
jgi:hypothetical protein